MAGLILLAGAVLFVVAIMLTRDNDAAVRRLAAPELACPEQDVVIVGRELTDTGESYALRGCGRAGELLCSTPDFECFFVER